MTRTSTETRLERLDLLATRLKSDEPLILKDIAAELGVSVRTLSRDVAILRERGLPIEADRGRGGGVRLHWSWGIGRMALSYREAVDLLVSLAIVEQMKSPILMANLAPVRRKVMASFSPADRSRVQKLKSRILIGRTASVDVQENYAPPQAGPIERFHEAFLLMKVAEIDYRDDKGTRTRRRIEPHFLLLNYPIWYALCWDRLRNDIRTFRCDRMRSVSLVEETFRMRPYADFKAGLEGVDLVLP